MDYDNVCDELAFLSLSKEDKSFMAQPFMERDIKVSLKLMHLTKAPGSDGYHVVFFFSQK